MLIHYVFQGTYWQGWLSTRCESNQTVLLAGAKKTEDNVSDAMNKKGRLGTEVLWMQLRAQWWEIFIWWPSIQHFL